MVRCDNRQYQFRRKVNRLLFFCSDQNKILGNVYQLENVQYLSDCNCRYTLLAWSHMSSFFLAVPAHCSFQILFQGGMIFYIVPMIVITINDITAYYVGFLIGKTPLIKVNKFRIYFKVLLFSKFIIIWDLFLFLIVI